MGWWVSFLCHFRCTLPFPPFSNLLPAQEIDCRDSINSAASSSCFLLSLTKESCGGTLERGRERSQVAHSWLDPPPPAAPTPFPPPPYAVLSSALSFPVQVTTLAPYSLGLGEITTSECCWPWDPALAIVVFPIGSPHLCK